MLLATSIPVSEAAAAESLNLALELYRTRRHDAACADLLGIADAVNGRFGDAERAALRARELAKGDAALGAAVEDHLARYALQQGVVVPRLRYAPPPPAWRAGEALPTACEKHRRSCN